MTANRNVSTLLWLFHLVILSPWDYSNLYDRTTIDYYWICPWPENIIQLNYLNHYYGITTVSLLACINCSIKSEMFWWRVALNVTADTTDRLIASHLATALRAHLQQRLSRVNDVYCTINIYYGLFESHNSKRKNGANINNVRKSF